MEYEKKYKDALERASKIYHSEFKPDEAAVLAKYLPMLFPELKKSKDERIRKAIYNALKYLETELSWDFVDEVDILDIYAWLEKQGEKKPTDEVEPKFKIGDWITDGQLTCKVLGVTGKSYDLHLHNDDYCHFETDIQCVDKYYRLWTIQDAKDGDVLVCEDENFTIPFIAIYKCLGDTVYNYKGLKDLTFNSHCFMGFNGNFYEGEGGHIIEGIHPATKEQHNLLFRKMKEAGYEWNSEKKELKKVEQKPDDNVEPKFKPGDWIIFNGLILHIDEVVNGYYRTTSRGDGIHNSYDWNIDNAARLWTIQEAKDGDVLINWNNTTFIFKAIEDETVKFHIAYNESWDTIKTPSTKLSHLGLPEPQFEFHPAAKEQRELLFEKMNEAEYEWDAEKKEVKKIEVISKENEDEQIKKEIIHILKGETRYTSKEDADKYVDWLEKQKGD